MTISNTSRGAARPGLRAWRLLIVAELKMVLRDTAGLLLPLGLPLLILVMNGLGDGVQTVVEGTGGRTIFDLYVMPLTFAIIIASIGVINMPSFLTYYRRAGILQRLAVTPASPSMVLIAQVAVSVLQALVGIGLALGVAILAFGIRPPVQLWAAIGAVALAAAAMYSIGMLIAALAPTPNSAIAIGLVLFFGMGATGGMFGPATMLPELLATVGEFMPFGAAIAAISGPWGGGAFELQPVLVLTAWILVCNLVAARWFRWT
ncbi:ABC transporter permease [Humidisolicoccus flavus]|uniref:ABC transporter permease n=1 Tax=Humidisolicoccus flavus TaxID=3111414 RepID=UPI00324D694E